MHVYVVNNVSGAVLDAVLDAVTPSHPLCNMLSHPHIPSFRTRILDILQPKQRLRETCYFVCVLGQTLGWLKISHSTNIKLTNH